MAEAQLTAALQEKEQIEAHPELSKDPYLAHNIEVCLTSKKAEVKFFKELLGKTQETLGD